MSTLNTGYTDGQQNAASAQSAGNAYGLSLALSSMSPNSFVDTYNPKLAFSLQTIGDDSTPIVRLRESATNQELDFYGDGSGWLSPSSKSSTGESFVYLQEWCTGKNCTVVKWYNQAKNADGTRYVNDLVQNTTAYQPVIWDASTGFSRDGNLVTPGFKRESNKFFLLQTPLNSKDFSSKELSAFLSYSSTTGGTYVYEGTIGNNTTYRHFINISSGGSLTIEPNLQEGSGPINYQALNTITSPSTYYTNKTIFEVHIKNDISTTSGKRLKVYGNNNLIGNIEIFNDADLQIVNSSGLRLLPSGSISTAGIRTGVGEKGFIRYYNTSSTVGGGTNYVSQSLEIKDSDINTVLNFVTGSTQPVEFGKEGYPLRLISTTLPTSNPVINGKTYTYVQISSMWVLTENLDSTIYPDGSAITEVTTDANWAASTSGVRRKYENVFGTYYNTYAANTIIAQGGYTAGGATWIVPNSTQLLTIYFSVFRTITRGGTTLDVKSRAYMYQLSDAEFAAAGNVGRWTRSGYFTMNYKIEGISAVSSTASPQELILFDNSVETSLRNEIVENRNKNLLKYDYGSNQLLNLYPAAIGAYSLRKLNNIPQKKLIQIKRDSDNALEVINYNVFGRLDTTVIETFCAGTTCRITTWYDQSGQGRDLIYDNTGSVVAPVIFESGAVVTDGGEPAVKFTSNGTTHEGLYTNSTYSPTNSVTLFTVFRRTSADGIAETVMKGTGVWIRRTTIASPNFWLGYGQNLSDATAIVNTTADAVYYISSNVTSSNATDLLISHNDNLGQYRTAGAQNTSSTRFTVGIDTFPTPTEGFTGFVKEIVLYGNNKSNDRFEIQNNINTYYNIYNELIRIDTPAEIRAELRLGYSLRLVSGTYAGALVKIRRANDSQEVDVFPDINGEISLNSRVSNTQNLTYTANLPNLGQFLNAGGYKVVPETNAYSAFVTTWYDQSLFGSNISNTTTTQQPQLFDGEANSGAGSFMLLNGKPGVYFNEVNLNKLYSQANVTEYLVSGTNSNTPYAGGTIVVFAVNNLPTSRVLFAYGTGTSSTSARDFYIQAASALHTYQYLNTAGNPFTKTNPITANNQYISISSREKNTITGVDRVYSTVDGYENTSVNASGTPKRNLALVQIGGYWISTTSPFGGYIQEILQFKDEILSHIQDLYLELQDYYNPATTNFLNVANILDATTYPATSNAFAAYSLRALTGNLNFTGGPRLVRIRRASDNIEVDVYANRFGYFWYDSAISNVVESTVTAEEKGNISGKTLGNFISGTNCFVVTWYDQSGNGRDVTQTTSALQPKIYDSVEGIVLDGVRPAIQFVAANSNRLVANTFNLSGTVTGSFTYSSNQTSAAFLVSGINVNSLKFGRILSGVSNTDAAGVSSYITTGTSLLIDKYSRTNVCLYNATASRIRALSTIEITGSTGNAVENTNLHIGTSASFDSYWDGKVQEIILWNSDEYATWGDHILRNANYYYKNYR